MTVTVAWQSVGPGDVALDGFSGATDDDKLAAAMSYAGQQTYKPMIRLSNRLYSFTKSLGLPYHGFGLVGAGKGQLGGVSTTHPGNLHTSVHLEMTPASGQPAGYWMDCSSGVLWDAYVGGISFYSNNGVTQFIRGAYPGGGIRECTFHDLTFQNLYAVLGNKAEALACTICNFTGGWQILDPHSTAVHIGGSDNRVIFDQGVDFFADGTNAGGNAGEQWMCIFDALGRSNVGPIYITASGGWRGLLVKGNKNAPQLIIDGATIEGNGSGAPVDGAPVRIEGGVVTLRDCSVSYGMANPSATATPNGGTADKGLIDISGSDTQVNIDGVGFCLGASPVTTSTPVIACSGQAIVRIANITKGNGGGVAWGAPLPVVQKDSTANVTVDNSVQLVAV